jgi:hypothetical protein
MNTLIKYIEIDADNFINSEANLVLNDPLIIYDSKTKKLVLVSQGLSINIRASQVSIISG